jgi:hypothetical protein
VQDVLYDERRLRQRQLNLLWKERRLYHRFEVLARHRWIVQRALAGQPSGAIRHWQLLQSQVPHLQQSGIHARRCLQRIEHLRLQRLDSPNDKRIALARPWMSEHRYGRDLCRDRYLPRHVLRRGLYPM